MQRTLALGGTLVVLSMIACSGSSSSPIGDGPGSSSGSSGSSGSSSGTSGIVCAPCEPKPDPACTGTGPCGCAPYDCPTKDAGTDDCVWAKTDSCGPGRYCLAPSCGAGKCVPLGAAESQKRDVVCGCDGVTYWNETIAAGHGMSVRRKNECGNGVETARCGGLLGQACPAKTFCNLKVPEKMDCNVVDQTGACWAIPSDCPPVVSARARSCVTNACADECSLIRQSQPWFETMVMCL